MTTIQPETATKLREAREDLEYLAESDFRVSKYADALLDILDEYDAK